MDGQESKCVELELKVFFEEIPELFDYIVTTILRLVRCLSGGGSVSTDPANRIHRLALTGPISGFVDLSGASIVRAELNVQFEQGKGANIKTAISSQFPWVLSQIQSAYSHAMKAWNALKPLLVKTPVLKDATLRTILDLLQLIFEEISAVCDDLLLPSRGVFPRTLYTAAVFRPRLPEDINLEFSIRRAELVARALKLQYLEDNSPVEEAGQIPTDLSSFAGVELMYKHKKVRVVDDCEVRVSVIPLRTALLLSHDILERTATARQKALALAALNPSR